MIHLVLGLHIHMSKLSVFKIPFRNWIIANLLCRLRFQWFFPLSTHSKDIRLYSWSLEIIGSIMHTIIIAFCVWNIHVEQVNTKKYPRRWCRALSWMTICNCVHKICTYMICNFVATSNIIIDAQLILMKNKSEHERQIRWKNTKEVFEGKKYEQALKTCYPIVAKCLVFVGT